MRLPRFIGLGLLIVSAPSVFAGSIVPATTNENTFAKSIHESVPKVDEFRILKEKAKSLNLRLWLFGGTAAAFAHYVKQDQAVKSGNADYQAERYGFNYVDIYRSTQDADLVVDGDPEKVAELEAFIQDRMNHFEGGKGEKWELRQLRIAKGEAGKPGYKSALLDDFDIANQNTDSHSTGLIEVTDPVPGESLPFGIFAIGKPMGAISF